jgi:hypothetical protein
MAIESMRAYLDDFYDQSGFGGRPEALSAGLTAVRHAQAVVDLVRGKLLHAEYLAAEDRPGEVPEELAAFESAAAGFADVGDRRGRGEALLWQGLYHQVVRSDSDTAAPLLESARAAAEGEGDDLTLSYAERHLGFHDWEGGRDTEARRHLERSVELRRGLGWAAGTAAGLLALCEFEATHGQPEVAAQHLAEAETLAAGVGAEGVLAWIRAADED